MIPPFAEGPPTATPTEAFKSSFIPGPESAPAETGDADPNQFVDTVEIPVVSGIDVPQAEQGPDLVAARAAVANAGESEGSPEDSAEQAPAEEDSTGRLNWGRGSVLGARRKMAAGVAGLTEAFNEHPAVVTARETSSAAREKTYAAGNKFGQAAAAPPRKDRATRQAEARPTDPRTADELRDSHDTRAEWLQDLHDPDSDASKDATDASVNHEIKRQVRVERELSSREGGSQLSEKQLAKQEKESIRTRRRELEATMAEKRRKENPKVGWGMEEGVNVLEDTKLTGEIGPDAKYAGKKLAHKALRSMGIENVMKDMDAEPEIQVLTEPLTDVEKDAYQAEITVLDDHISGFNRKLGEIPEDSNNQADKAKRVRLQAGLDQVQADQRDLRTRLSMDEVDRQIAEDRDPRTIAPPDENSVWSEGQAIEMPDSLAPPRVEDFISHSGRLNPDSPRARLEQAGHYTANEIKRGVRGSFKKVVSDPIDKINNLGPHGPVREAGDITAPPRAKDFKSIDNTDPNSAINDLRREVLTANEKRSAGQTDAAQETPQTNEAREALDNQSSDVINNAANRADIEIKMKQMGARLVLLNNRSKAMREEQPQDEVDELNSLRAQYSELRDRLGDDKSKPNKPAQAKKQKAPSRRTQRRKSGVRI